MATEPKTEMETQGDHVAKIKAKAAAEKAAEIEGKIKAAKKEGLSAKALDLYTKALNEKQSPTLVPAAKAQRQDEEGNEIGNHLVEVELVDGKPVEANGMVVVRHK